MIEVSKAVIEKDGKFLLLKRASHSATYPEMWDFAGGKLEDDETPQESVIREVKEETSLDIEPGEAVKTAVHHKGKLSKPLIHFFKSRLASGNVHLSSEHSDFKWVTKNEMKTLPLHPAVELYFKR